MTVIPFRKHPARAAKSESNAGAVLAGFTRALDEIAALNKLMSSADLEDEALDGVLEPLSGALKCLCEANMVFADAIIRRARFTILLGDLAETAQKQPISQNALHP